MTINNEQIQALKAAALAATTGEWTPDDNFGFTVQCYRTGTNRLLATVNGPNAENDMQFIAQASPQNILRVLAEREADKALIAESVALFETLRQRIAELEARTVKLPSINPQMFNDDVIFGYRKAQREAVEFCAVAGINLETGE